MKRTRLIILSILAVGFAMLGPTSNEVTADELKWGRFERTCVTKCCNQPACMPATTRYAAILWGIPWGGDWEWYCEHTSSSVTDPGNTPAPNPPAPRFRRIVATKLLTCGAFGSTKMDGATISVTLGSV
jgi:hypothetical protein